MKKYVSAGEAAKLLNVKVYRLELRAFHWGTRA